MPKYKQNRKNLQPKAIRIGIIEAQAQKNRYLIEEMEKRITDIKADIDTIKTTLGLVEKKDKTQCKYCGRLFKDISRHKCKVKSVEVSA